MLIAAPEARLSLDTAQRIARADGALGGMLERRRAQYGDDWGLPEPRRSSAENEVSLVPVLRSCRNCIGEAEVRPTIKMTMSIPMVACGQVCRAFVGLTPPITATSVISHPPFTLSIEGRDRC